MKARQAGSSLWAFVDLLFNAFFIVVCLFVMQSLLPHAKAQEDAKKAGIAPGRMCVELFWPDDLDIDVDLWARGPDGNVLGYKNRSVPYMDLLRDDLGILNDPSGRNYETACSRELVKGNWTFNAHYYSAHQENPPADVPVRLILSFLPSDTPASKQPPIVASAILHGPNQEITLLDLDLDESGMVVPGSTNAIFQALRSTGFVP